MKLGRGVLGLCLELSHVNVRSAIARWRTDRTLCHDE